MKLHPAQRAYIAAKANLKAIKACNDESERKYISEKGFVNSDGKIPEHIWCIDDKDVFEKANAEFTNEISDYEAREALLKAEDDIIAWQMSIAPAKIRKVLEPRAKRFLDVREQIIELAITLDASTVPACFKA